MKCPHCTVGVHEDWTTNGISLHRNSTTWRVEIMRCPSCDKDILRFGRGSWINASWRDPPDWILIYPRGSNRGPVSTDVPPSVTADYIEAANVLAISPKASAALSRRCLQAVLQEAGYKHRDLAKQIDAALNETDARKALPSSIHTILDSVRNFGNFSAHPITDQTTLQIIDVEDHEAEHCLDVLDAVFDHYYIRPADARRKKDALNAKLAKAGKPPSK